MSDDAFVVQKVEWFQLRDSGGQATLVMVASLPNGFFTATPCEIPMRHADHSLIGLGASAEAALEGVQQNLAGKARAEIFPEAKS